VRVANAATRTSPSRESPLALSKEKHRVR
jgi:hypothetical protein